MTAYMTNELRAARRAVGMSRFEKECRMVIGHKKAYRFPGTVEAREYVILVRRVADILGDKPYYKVETACIWCKGHGKAKLYKRSKDGNHNVFVRWAACRQCNGTGRRKKT